MGMNNGDLETIFEEANKAFLSKNVMLFETEVSERTLCGALMIELHEVLKGTKYFEYFVDVEYNRNLGGKLKKITRGRGMPITINCDLIVHSRGQNSRDNLIALEMKKSTHEEDNKQNNRERLKCLTTSPGADAEIYSADGKTFPKYVCGYGLGVYYEIDFATRRVSIEYYEEGECYKTYQVSCSRNGIM